MVSAVAQTLIHTALDAAIKDCVILALLDTSLTVPQHAKDRGTVVNHVITTPSAARIIVGQDVAMLLFCTALSASQMGLAQLVIMDIRWSTGHVKEALESFVHQMNIVHLENVGLIILTRATSIVVTRRLTRNVPFAIDTAADFVLNAQMECS